MSVVELKARYAAATATVNTLSERLKQRRSLLLDTDVSGYARSQGRSAISFSPTDLVCCRILQGHTGKLAPVIKHVFYGMSRRAKGFLFFGGEFPSGHTTDVLSVSINSSNSNIFVSGSCDATAWLWDTRIASCAIRTYNGHQGDVNTVKFFPDGQRFGTGSDDSTCQLYDMRTKHQLQVYSQQHDADDNDVPIVTAIVFSSSRRLLFAGYSSGDCYVWDTLVGEVVLNLGTLQNSHESRIRCLGLSSDGSPLCTGSWDKNLKIWAFGGHRRVI